MARKKVAPGTFGAWLMSAQIAAGVSNAALARAVGVDPATVSQWRTNAFPPDEAKLPAIARALEVPLGAVRGARFGEAPTAAHQAEGHADPRAHVPGVGPGVVPELALPVDLELAALDFERDAVAAGADATFVRFARTMLRAPALVRLLAAESTSARGAQYQALVTALRVMQSLRAAGGPAATTGVAVEVSHGRDVTQEADQLRRRGADGGKRRGGKRA